jgi:uncharacterized lipoprotein YmbA
MMRGVFRCGAVLACAIGVVALGGCGSSPTRFYALSAVSPGAGLTAGVARPGPALGVGPVSVPERLNRPEIVTWVNENMLHLAEFERWAAPLQDSVTRVLAENLSVLVPTDRAVVFPWMSDAPIEYEVRVDVSRFEGSLGKDCTLVARWSIVRRADKQTTAGRSSHTDLAGESYATLVAAQSRLIAALSRDIAAALGAMGQHKAAETGSASDELENRIRNSKLNEGRRRDSRDLLVQQERM